MEEYERSVLNLAISRNATLAEAASALEIDLSTLMRKKRKYGIRIRKPVRLRVVNSQPDRAESYRRRGLILFQFPGSPGDLAEAESQFPGDCPLGHTPFQKSNEGPSGGNISYLVLCEKALQESFYQLRIFRFGKRFGEFRQRCRINIFVHSGINIGVDRTYRQGETPLTSGVGQNRVYSPAPRRNSSSIP